MDIGMGFWLGALMGAAVAMIAAVIIIVSRKAVGNGSAGNTKTAPRANGGETKTIVRSVSAPQPAPSPQSPPPPKATTIRTEVVEDGGGRRERSGNTMIVEAVESRDQQLAASIQEVRDMLLTLADLIARTESASGRAADAFSVARSTIHKLQSTQSPELQEAQRVLLSEIDRVLATNAALHSELDRANRGIADQRKQIETLRVQARVDALTRVPNRAAFDERLAEYFAVLQRSSAAFSLLLLDIDHFKRVNDDHGHTSGDRILRGIASKIAESVRVNDFVARYGGEEFAVIFPGAGAEEALPVAERIRADIAKTNFRMDQKTLKITVSGGLAEASPQMTQVQIVEAADASLYASKDNGRNRITVHEKEKAPPV